MRKHLNKTACVWLLTLRVVKKALVAVVALLTIFHQVPAHSESTLEELMALSFEELINYEIVTPTKSGVPLVKIPVAVSVITYQDIQRSSASTIPELLRSLPGVNVRWSPMTQVIDIHGFGSNPFTSKILLMIDGVPYNSWNKGGFPQHPGFDFFNLNNVKHIEVVRGSSSALYGENALNGVINIVTFSGEEFEATQAKLVAGNNEARSLSLISGKRIGVDSSYFVSARASNNQLPTDLWRDGDSDAQAYDLFIKGKYKGLQLSYYRRQDTFDGFDVPVESPAFPPGSKFKSADEIKQSINVFAAQYNYHSSDDRWSFQANTSYSNRDGSHCAACHSPGEHPDFEKEEDHGNQLFANMQIGLHIPNHTILVGMEYRKLASGQHTYEFAGSNRISEDTVSEETRGNRSDNVTQYSKAALFLQDSWAFLDEKWKLIYGVRYDSETSPALFKDELFPRIAIVGNLNDDTTLRLNWSQAARYPSFTELYQSSRFLAVSAPNVTIPLAQFEPNPALQPENIESWEVGLSYNVTPFAQLKIDVFQNTIKDSIIIAYPVFRFENHPNDARIRGMDVELITRPSEQISAFINWSYQDSEERGDLTDSSGNSLELTYAPKHKINFGATYTPWEYLSATLEANWKDEYIAPSFWYPLVFDNPEVKPLDDYLFVNFRLNYQPPIVLRQQNRALTISLIGKNLTDEKPYETLTGLGGKVAGREFFVNLTYTWPL
jgi:outer membrane receptor protein involved in Fe transport